MKNRIYVVEDHPFMRRTIVAALERDPRLAVCGEAENAMEAFAAIVTLHPDLVLTDIELKSSSALDLIKTLRAHAPALPIVATTMFNVGVNERLVRAAGAAGFVAKQDGPERLITVVHDVLRRDDRPHPF